jgi:hypothetical protein
MAYRYGRAVLRSLLVCGFGDEESAGEGHCQARGQKRQQGGSGRRRGREKKEEAEEALISSRGR